MLPLTRPGIYPRPVKPTRRAGGLARRDVPVFLGFTSRGPADAPVRVESVRQFVAVFGNAFPDSHLFDAVKGFFETGGRAAYIVRVIGEHASVAGTCIETGGLVWRFLARTRTADLANLLPDQTLLPWQDHLIRRYNRSIPDPGSWANAITLRITSDEHPSRSAATVSGDRTRLRPARMTGLDKGAVVQLSQQNQRADAVIVNADAARREITLERSLPANFTVDGGDLRIAPRTVSLEVLWSGQRVEAFPGLSLSVASPAFIASVVNQFSRMLEVVAPDGFDPATDSSLPEDDYPLTGGVDGLRTQAPADWLRALGEQAFVDEIALLAAPDLVRQQSDEEQERDRPREAPPACDQPAVRPRGGIAARVADADTEQGIKGARIEIAGEGLSTTSGEHGGFVLENVVLGLVELRISAPGYRLKHAQAQSSRDQTRSSLNAPVDKITPFYLLPIEDVPALTPDEIDTVQRAMLDAPQVGEFRIAVLDPPGPQWTAEQLLDWVAALGRPARGCAAGPWLGLPSGGAGALRLQPPSGHVCGAFAAAEAGQGVHRAPGNIMLRHVKSVPLSVSDAIAADFHRAGMNLIEAQAARGIRLMGARLLTDQPAWRQASVRRLFDALERTLLSRLQWAVFEPANPSTRQLLKFAIEQFLERLRRRGMFAGATPDAAYSVRCDDALNPPAAQARSALVAEIAVAPTQPYEFITFSLVAEAEAIEVTERA